MRVLITDRNQRFFLARLPDVEMPTGKESIVHRLRTALPLGVAAEC